MKKKLENNFYDCHVTSTPSDNQCKNLYQKCAENGFSSICGQSLLKLMSNVSPNYSLAAATYFQKKLWDRFLSTNLDRLLEGLSDEFQTG